MLFGVDVQQKVVEWVSGTLVPDFHFSYPDADFAGFFCYEVSEADGADFLSFTSSMDPDQTFTQGLLLGAHGKEHIPFRRYIERSVHPSMIDDFAYHKELIDRAVALACNSPRNGLESNTAGKIIAAYIWYCDEVVSNMLYLVSWVKANWDPGVATLGCLNAEPEILAVYREQYELSQRDQPSLVL